MTAKTRTRCANAPLIVMLSLLLMPLLYAGEAGALYPPDGTKPDGSGGYMIPADGMCVIGVKLDGTMLVDWSIANYRDCVAWTKSADSSVDLVSMDTQAKCVNAGGAGNDGYKHAWSTSLCYDVANSRGISRVDLDNTDPMCFSKGGAVVTTGKCVAYGWVYRNRKDDNTLPVSGTGLSTTDGVQSTDGLGFCATSMRMTSATFTSAATCPSKHNSATLSPAEWPACLSSLTGCQTQASYDAGLGWSFASSQCLYAYGVKGILSAAATKADGTTYAVGTTQDLTLYTNQGDCLANGFSWDNWLPVAGTTTKDNTSGGEFAGMPAGAVIRRLDALTSVEDGGGEFYSGTGAICEKCHSDQSRAYQERQKPGFPRTRHKLAGDAIGKPFQPNFTAAGSAWGLQGVQCSICHSTAKPAQDDIIQIIPAGVVGPPAAGAPKSAAGHNNTEYGTHLLDICYTCHGTPASPLTINPASVIPVSSGDFALTAKGLAPIANQFLNGPHAKYTGSSTKVDIGDKTKYGSTFEGYVCRTAATQFRNNAAPGDTPANCAAAGLTWYTTTGFGNFCYYNSVSCTALSTGQWLTTFDAVAYSWAAATGGPGGLCAGVGIGSIITTVYRNGVAEKIPNLDSTTNLACTNAGDGSATSGASGFWVKDGETSPNGIPADTAQGNCMTCHDVHWALADTDPEAEPIRRECTTCHENAGTSAAGAPQVDLTTINHLKSTGTPLEHWLTDPDEACETCHMPKSGGEESSTSPMHLWRISTDSTYTTMGATQVNTTPDGLAWVDIDHACGQCHGGGTVQDAQHQAEPPAPYRTKAALAAAAKGMHDAAPVTYAVTFTAKVTGLKVDVTAQVTCGDGIVCPTFTYDWDWADATAHGTANPDTHTYASYAARKIVLTVRLGGKIAGSATRSVTPAPPTATFAATITGLKVDVLASASCGGSCPAFTYDWKWGDGTAHGSANPGTHTYATAGTKTITLTLSEGGKILATTAKNVRPTNAVADLPPTASATCTWDANTWTATVVDASTDTDISPVQTVTVDWGDLSARAVGGPGATLLHTYIAPPKSPATSYTLTLTAIDSALKASTPLTLTCTPSAVAPAYFAISGTVYATNGTTPLPSAAVTVKKGTSAIKTVYTAAGGTFSAGSLKPGTYTLTVRKSGYTFAAPAATITVGPNSGGNNLVATGP